MRTSIINLAGVAAIACAVANEGNKAAERLNNFKTNLEGMIAEIVKGEATVSKLLAAASRDLLSYVPETGDIGMVNRLLEGLSKANRNHAFVFFKTFLEWDVSEAGLFTTKMTGKRRSISIEAERVKFLAAEANNLWTWEKRRRVLPTPTEAQIKERVVTRITNDIKKGLTEVKLSPLDILKIISEAGITVGEIVRLADVMKTEAEKVAAKEAKAADKAKAPLKSDAKRPGNTGRKARQAPAKRQPMGGNAPQAQAQAVN
jgi:hypothetical protein